ncbi:MAG: MATE family efflux transporter [Victivallales bacterium]
MNIAAANYGDVAVAAMSIVGRIFFLVLAILIGFGHGFQPVVGYNYGAKRYGRVHEAFFFCVKAGTVFSPAPESPALFSRRKSWAVQERRRCGSGNRHRRSAGTVRSPAVSAVERIVQYAVPVRRKTSAGDFRRGDTPGHLLHSPDHHPALLFRIERSSNSPSAFRISSLS